MADNAKIKVFLSTKENPEILDDLNKILSLLGKNYNDMKTTEKPDLNIKRMIISISALIYEENIYDYKLFKPDGEPYLNNNNNLGFDVNSKNILQVCSNSYDTIPIISDPLSIQIDKFNELYDELELNVIFSNLCKSKNALIKYFTFLFLIF